MIVDGFNFIVENAECIFKEYPSLLLNIIGIVSTLACAPEIVNKYYGKLKDYNKNFGTRVNTIFVNNFIKKNMNDIYTNPHWNYNILLAEIKKGMEDSLVKDLPHLKDNQSYKQMWNNY